MASCAASEMAFCAAQDGAMMRTSERVVSRFHTLKSMDFAKPQVASKKRIRGLEIHAATDDRGHRRFE
jgi:hypothetical protein